MTVQRKTGFFTTDSNGAATVDCGFKPDAVFLAAKTTYGGNPGVIDTGLSDIEQFFIYKESMAETGMIHLHYSKQGTSRMYASAWSTSNYGTKTIANGTGGVTVDGGELTISATSATSGGVSSGKTYEWIAIGTE